MLELVHVFKRTGSSALAGYLAQPMATLIAQRLAADKALGERSTLRLVPVPSRPDSMRRRGFVPAELIAKAVASRLRTEFGISAYASSLVTLNRKVKDQALLNLQERAANVSGAMVATAIPQVRGQRIDDSKRAVVVIDDVVTTGATLKEMHRALLKAGWNPLFFVTFAETL